MHTHMPRQGSVHSTGTLMSVGITVGRLVAWHALAYTRSCKLQGTRKGSNVRIWETHSHMCDVWQACCTSAGLSIYSRPPNTAAVASEALRGCTSPAAPAPRVGWLTPPHSSTSAAGAVGLVTCERVIDCEEARTICDLE